MTARLRVLLTLLVAAVSTSVVGCGRAVADGTIATPVDGVAFEQRLGADVPRDVHLRDESGRDVDFSSLGHGRPTVLALVYYRCPMLCTMLLDGLVRGLRGVAFVPGKDYDLVCVSIDPDETPAVAATTKTRCAHAFGRAGTEEGWHFLTGGESDVHRLADAVGFRYRHDAASGQFAHAAGIVVLTPQARVSRYLFGIDFQPTDLRLSLVEASDGTIAGPLDQALLYCFCWDPTTGRYGLAVMRVLRAACAATVLGLAATMIVLSRRRRTAAPVGSRGS